MGGQFCYSSDPPLASGLWPLAARWPLSECKSRRCWSGVCQSDSGYVMSFRAKHFDSPCLCHLLQFLLLQLLSLANLFWKITATVSPPDRDLSEQHRPQWARARQGLLFTDGDYVIISIRAKKKRNPVTFQDVWWVRISIMTHYNSIHMMINSCGYVSR